MWGIALIALVVICALTLIALGIFFWRLRAIGSRVGSFECALLEGGRWRAGIATYSRNHLNWHRVVSLAPTPSRQFNRRELHILGRDIRQLDSGISTVSEARCIYFGDDVRIAANDGALDGLVSWLEASPPQTHRG